MRSAFAVWFLITTYSWEARHLGKRRPFLRARLFLYRWMA